MKNQTAQNVAAAQASILWCNHPKLLNHPSVHDCLKIVAQILPDIPTVQGWEHIIGTRDISIQVYYVNSLPQSSCQPF